MADQIQFGEDLELDLRTYELRRDGRVLKLERIPMELLLLLIEGRGQLVARSQIIERIWGKSVFLDTDNSINAAIRKIRQVLKDDPEQPRFVQTVTGRGYRFIAQMVEVIAVPTPALADTSTETAKHLEGKKIGHYRILQLLGGGGMGVVYKAEDLKLGRRVAIKFLPEELAHNAKAFDRFAREARAASALDHPNICSIYELGEHAGRPFIVMQLLEGQTLREWIASVGQQKKLLLTNEMIDLATQVVKGLAAAHEKSIVHCDIKPANIFITNRGTVKILDFGLAKMIEEGLNSETLNRNAVSETANPTEPAPASSNLLRTLTGGIMGTAHYMSPEQVRAEQLDARTDLFSFGLVLYEMVTGERAFTADTVAEIHDAVLHKFAIPARQLRPDLPADMERIISRAIEKDRELRYQTAIQVREDLERLAFESEPKQADFTLAPSKIEIVEFPRRKLGLWRSLAVILPLAALVIGTLYYRSVRANRLSETDRIVIADFDNSTGDPVLGDTLKQGLDIALGQSPFLSIESDDEIRSALRQMTRPAETVLTPDVAREVCQRTGSKAYVGGVVAALGTEYVLSLNAVNCRSGNVMVREQTTAPAKEKVIAALGEAASKLRGKLGESLSTMQKYDVPLEEATTPSLEALKSFSLARAAALQGSVDTAIPFYKHAVELDPNFAAAYAHMAQAYANSSQGEFAKASIRQAFQRRMRASEPEKFYITTRYYELATGETDKRIEALRLWRLMYPRETTAANDLAVEYNDMGKFDLAVKSARDALRLSPDAYTPYENLGMAYLGMNRFSDAKAIRRQELAANLGLHWTHIDLYGIAVVENDAATMQQEIEWAKGKTYEFFMLEIVAGEEAASGRLQKARETYRQAMECARRAKFDEVASNMDVDLDLVETELGNLSRTSRPLSAVPNNDHARKAAAHIFAMTGDSARAGAIVAELLKDNPSDTYINNVWVPSIRAEIEISRGDPVKAIEILKVASPYEFGWKAHGWPSYVRGLAYLQAHNRNEAAAEFQRILDHRGVCLADSLAPVFYALSHLQLARVQAMSGDTSGARTAYQHFFNLWKDADPDLPILKQAKAEYAKIR